jgi:hypothetical protein
MLLFDQLLVSQKFHGLSAFDGRDRFGSLFFDHRGFQLNPPDSLAQVGDEYLRQLYQKVRQEKFYYLRSKLKSEPADLLDQFFESWVHQYLLAAFF